MFLTYTKKHQNKIIYWSLFAMMLIDRFLLLNQFAINYLDDDQCVFWNGAKEYAKGNFNEPYFYGQDYNPMLESLLAVPFLKIGIPVNIALPLTTSLMVVFPFMAISYILLRKRKEINAILIISIPLLMTNEYGLLTSIPRGFVSGTFISTFAYMSISIQKRYSFFAFSFFSILALYMNPNAVIVIFPLCLYVLLKNYSNYKLYVYAALGAIPSIIIYVLSKKFYEQNPNYLVHKMWDIKFSLDEIKFKSKMHYFSEVTPITSNTNWASFGLIAFIFIALVVQKQYKAGICLAFASILIFLSLGINKVNDGYPTIYYSWSRMYLGIPILLALSICSISIYQRSIYFKLVLAVFVCSYFLFKTSTLDDCIKKNIDTKADNNVTVGEWKDLKSQCKTIKNLASKYHASLVVINWKHFVNYACPCIYKEFPETIEPEHDKRTWQLLAEENKIRRNILFICAHEYNLSQKFHHNTHVIKLCNDPIIYIY
ncbi:MAG: hypothetical protein HYZ42_00950, partial [Bacteroidetes bacterium]|nr:hypothetical protein [Bacteroidota bacterium]